MKETSEIQGTERTVPLVAIVSYMPYSICSSKSRLIMMSILPVTKTQWIGAMYRESGTSRRKVSRGKGYYLWQKTSVLSNEYVQVW